METNHKIIFKNASKMNELQDNSVDLMITSPPYPMIQMWDEIFSQQNPEIKKALEEHEGNTAFELMHKELDKVWCEVYRVLKEGGIACINIGDATRSVNGSFKMYSNHSRILSRCLSLGFHTLPSILWRKQTNAPNKFMGSGMLPVGAYVTLEHEHILILRKGNKREFDEKQKIIRQNSAFFWEERNQWFSDIWENLKGTSQRLNHKELRERSGAFPFELVYRLINMYSIHGDTVLDPFLGTGTTTVASMCSTRNSIGYEIIEGFKQLINDRITDVIPFCEEYTKERVSKHNQFIKDREIKKGRSKYNATNYGFDIITSQEKNVLFYLPIRINQINDNSYRVEHKEFKLDIEIESKVQWKKLFKNT